MPVAMPALLDDMIAVCDGLSRAERIELLTDYATQLPQPPAALLADAARWQAVPECLTPVRVAVEVAGDRYWPWVDVPEEAVAVRAVASVIVLGCAGATPEQILALPADLPLRVIGPEMIGRRRLGLMALVGRLKSLVARGEDDAS